jgi:hypothetical protein
VLYKVTPTIVSVEKLKAAKKDHDEGAPKEARKRRKSAVFDGEGNEVLITMMCLKCRSMKPLTMFGLRKMADGAIRNQPWCRTCRSGATAKKKPGAEAEQAAPLAPAATEPASAVEAPDEVSAPS